MNSIRGNPKAIRGKKIPLQILSRDNIKKENIIFNIIREYIFVIILNENKPKLNRKQTKNIRIIRVAVVTKKKAISKFSLLGKDPSISICNIVKNPVKCITTKKANQLIEHKKIIFVSFVKNKILLFLKRKKNSKLNKKHYILLIIISISLKISRAISSFNKKA